MNDNTEEYEFNCPHCGQHLAAEPDMAGMELECPSCGKPVKVPLTLGKTMAASARENLAPLANANSIPNSATLHANGDANGKKRTIWNTHKRSLTIAAIFMVLVLICTIMMISKKQASKSSQIPSTNAEDPSESYDSGRHPSLVHVVSPKNNPKKNATDNKTSSHSDSNETFTLNGVTLGSFIYHEENYHIYRLSRYGQSISKRHDKVDQYFPTMISVLLQNGATFDAMPRYKGQNCLCSSYYLSDAVKMLDWEFGQFLYTSSSNRIFATSLVLWQKPKDNSDESSLAFSKEFSNKKETIQQILSEKYGAKRYEETIASSLVVSRWETPRLSIYITEHLQASKTITKLYPCMEIEYIDKEALEKARKDCGMIGGKKAKDIIIDSARDLL
jgi:DNA-directed RNA polymerase subunit RPC12/RpoP